MKIWLMQLNISSVSPAARWLVSQNQDTGTMASPSSVHHQSRDLLRYGIDNEGQEQREDDQDNQGDDVLFEPLPDQVDAGLHGIGEPGEAGGRATGGKQKITSHHQ